MISRLAKEVAKKYLTQSLRLQPDYGERQSADFLGDRNVARNTGYGDKLKSGPGNAFDEVVADNAVQVGTSYDGGLEADNAVQVSTGYDLGLEADLDADELEGFEIVDDMGIERMSDFWKESRFSKGEKGREEFEEWMEDQPEDFQEEWESNTEKYKDVVKDLAEERAEKSADEIIDDIGLDRMASDLSDPEISHSLKKRLVDSVSRIDKTLSKITLDDLSDAVEDMDAVESALLKSQESWSDLFVDVDGHPLFASFHEEVSGAFESFQEAIEEANHEITSMIDRGLADEGNERYVYRVMDDEVLPTLEYALKDIEDLIRSVPRGSSRRASKQIGKGRNGYVAMWNRERVEVFADSTYEAQELAQKHFQKSTRKRVKGYDITVVLAEKGGKQVTHRPMFASDRMAKDHEDSGSYMSRQNLREMSDMADFIVDDIGMDDLDDWVEDKISHAHSALNDVARYRGYRDDYPHGEDKGYTFKFAEDDEIIDDLEY